MQQNREQLAQVVEAHLEAIRRADAAEAALAHADGAAADARAELEAARSETAATASNAGAAEEVPIGCCTACAVEALPHRDCLPVAVTQHALLVGAQVLRRDLAELRVRLDNGEELIRQLHGRIEGGVSERGDLEAALQGAQAERRAALLEAEQRERERSELELHCQNLRAAVRVIFCCASSRSCSIVLAEVL